jgi:L-alanine-DL-glutamate epimerase-like enolase superfamily enzyme
MPNEFPSIVSQNESVRWRGPTIGLYFHVVSRFDLAPFGAVPFDRTTCAKHVQGFNPGNPKIVVRPEAHKALPRSALEKHPVRRVGGAERATKYQAPRPYFIFSEAIGPNVELCVDANGAYSRKQALTQAECFAELDVRWFEEPVSSDDLEGLRLLRDRAPASMNIAAVEYGYDACYFRRMLAAGAVDVLQADATRCGGITGFMQAGILCEAFGLPFSFHCAPAVHLAAACALPAFWVGEYFFDHARIENMFFDGVPQPIGGALKPDRSQPGCGLAFKYTDAAPFAL